VVGRVRVAFGVACIGLGLGAEWFSYRPGELGSALADLGVGWVLIGSGLFAWQRRAQSRVGPLLAASGAAWFLGSFSSVALFLHRGPLVHALVAYPTGRVARRTEKVVVIAAYLDAAIAPLARDAVVTLVVCGAIVLSAIRSYVAEAGPRRRARAGGAIGAAALASALGLGAFGRIADWNVDSVMLGAYEVILVVVALGLLGDLLRRRWSQGAVTGLIVDLGGLWEPVTLRDRLAQALGDSSLQLGYRLTTEQGYVDEAGGPFTLPAAGGGRVLTPIDSDGELVAVLVHDRAVLDDPALVEAVASATRIAVANVRLQAQVRARVEQIAASRRRIVEAAGAQRQQLERELRRGAQQALADASEHVASLAEDTHPPRTRQMLAGVETQLTAARDELSELGRGIHPAALTSGGLAPALRELAARSPVHVKVSVGLARFPAAVEAAVYFVCAEALANVAKHAHAVEVQISVQLHADRLAVTIIDDGVGGANAESGLGLRGLADRVEALGGQLSVHSPPGHGTQVGAEIPTD
jgi:signal transduction histidine kinase